VLVVFDLPVIAGRLTTSIPLLTLGCYGIFVVSPTPQPVRTVRCDYRDGYRGRDVIWDTTFPRVALPTLT